MQLKLKVVEVFTSFTEVGDSSTFRLHKLITDPIWQKELDMENCCKQGYDGVAVVNRKYSGLQKKIQDVALST